MKVDHGKVVFMMTIFFRGRVVEEKGSRLIVGKETDIIRTDFNVSCCCVVDIFSLMCAYGQHKAYAPCYKFEWRWKIGLFLSKCKCLSVIIKVTETDIACLTHFCII